MNLTCGIVLRTQEQTCEVVVETQPTSVGYAPSFPSPRAERVLPGHLVALALTPGGVEVVWRWFDAVVLGEQAGLVQLWEPAHGEVVAHPRTSGRRLQPGTRAYLSAGLPGADWWVAGPTVARAEDAEVELAEVERFLSEHWRN
jgi:hypothetical protein